MYQGDLHVSTFRGHGSFFHSRWDLELMKRLFWEWCSRSWFACCCIYIMRSKRRHEKQTSSWGQSSTVRTFNWAGGRGEMNVSAWTRAGWRSNAVCCQIYTVISGMHSSPGRHLFLRGWNICFPSLAFRSALLSFVCFFDEFLLWFFSANLPVNLTVVHRLNPLWRLRISIWFVSHVTTNICLRIVLLIFDSSSSVALFV